MFHFITNISMICVGCNGAMLSSKTKRLAQKLEKLSHFLINIEN